MCLEISDIELSRMCRASDLRDRLQWGDEAKGKIVDLLTEQHEIVVRYQGGANAGHTVVRGGQTYKLSLVPSGIFRPGVQCVIAAGVVLNPASLLDEIDGLLRRGIAVGKNLMISDRAHVIFPWHVEEDRLLDQSAPAARPSAPRCAASAPAIATRSAARWPCGWAICIGPISASGSSRSSGRRTNCSVAWRQATARESQARRRTRSSIKYHAYAERLAPHVADTTAYLLDAVEAGKRMLFEGAQGSLLDIDHGTFPFVTSSNSSGVGVSAGSGVPGRYITKVIGVIKAYTTRVGGGPFPTEQDNEIGEHIRDRGNEYGTVTRRPRRCGWFDAVAARYTARLGGVDALAVMLLDVLERAAGAEDLHGLRTRRPADHRFSQPRGRFAARRAGLRDAARLAARDRRRRPARRLAGQRAKVSRPPQRVVRRPVEIVSVGPDRRQTIFARMRVEIGVWDE